MIAPRFRRVAVPAVIGVIALALTGCSSSSSDAATITYRSGGNDQTIHITSSDFKNELAGLVGSVPFQTLLKSNSNLALVGDQKNTTGANLSASYLGTRVEQAAVDAEFARLGLKVTDAQRAAALSEEKQGFGDAVFASFPKSLQNSLVERRAREDALGAYYSALTPEKEQALYDEFSSVICPSGKDVAHILVKDQATAKALLAQIQGGASFAALAQAKSTDTASAKAGGSLGCLRTGNFVKEFETAAFAAPFGVVVGPVKSQFGYHLILVSHADYAAIRAQLTQALQRNPGLIAKDLRMQEMKVRINPQFGTGGLAVDQQQGLLTYQVKPPAVPDVRTQREKGPATTSTTATVPAGG